MKLVTIILAVMWLSLSTYATAVLADDRDQKIEMLETLLERYIEENRELKALVEALEERTPSQSVAAGATTCANDPSKCEDTVLCTFAVTLTEGNYIWSTQPQWINYVQEAQKRGLNCKVSETASQQESTAVLTCETDPQVCGDEELCSLATDEYKAWKSGVSQKFVDEARDRNLECGVASTPQAPSQSAAAGATTCANDPSKCEDTVLCTFAVTLTEGNYIWATQPQWINYVQEAQKRGLNCNVSETASQQESTAVLTCETDPQVCGDEELCSLATDGYKAWKSGENQKFVEEARDRNLECGVASTPQAPSQSVAAGATTCANDPSKCEDTVLCTFAVTLTEGNYIWSTQPQWINYVQEAQKRGLNCKVSETASQQESTAVLTCETDPQVCGDEELCSLATDEYKAWKSGVSQKFVDEARERNLECGIVKVTEAPTQNMPGCTEDHEILAKFARELFSKQSTGKEFWTSCSKGGTIISLGFSDGQTIAYNQSSSFRGFVFGPDSAVFFGGAVVCFDADLGVKKRGKGFYCSEQ